MKIQRVKEDLHKALDNAERTRKRTGSSEDRDFVMLIREVRGSVFALQNEERNIRTIE